MPITCGSSASVADATTCASLDPQLRGRFATGQHHGARAVGDFKTTLIYADDAPSAREAEWVEAAFALNEPADILRIRRFGRNLSCKTRYLDIWSPADTR